MQPANQNAPSSDSPRANGHSQLHELFALTDEQILEIDPAPQDVEVAGVAPAALLAGLDNAGTDSERGIGSSQQPPQSAQAQTAQAGVPALHAPPAWLADTMSDPQRGAEARALWDGVQRTEREAAAYREVFAKPEEARSAAARARQLDDIDRAYFAGDATQRAQLATLMMREDPAAFREMVFAGLRALEETGKPVSDRSVADALSRSGNASPNSAGSAGATLASPAANGAGASTGGASPAPTTNAQQAQLAAYAAFEQSANQDLERSVGSAIERTLDQALPATGRADSAALKGRMAAAIRQDIEKALQGDRQLGEQVAQILSAKRLDSETRAQVVRLIGERAQQLVPGATKRALNDWTQTTLATHRAKSRGADAHAARTDLTPAAAQGGRGATASAKDAARGRDEKNRASSTPATTNSGRVDYRRLSDDQILDL